MMKPRCFKIVDPSKPATMPVRATKNSAGYDLYAAQDVTIEPGRKAIVPTNITAYMAKDEVLLIHPRSSYCFKYDLMLVNGVGVIDADYQKEILVGYRNMGIKSFRVKKGDRIAQGVFCKFLKVANDNATGDRNGGIGSTGK